MQAADRNGMQSMENDRESKCPPTDRVLAAMKFAERCHRGQTRRGAHGRVSYYDEHILGVYHILKDECHVQEEDVLVTALLHDTVEDTPCSLEDIERSFGSEIREQVDLLSRVDGEPFSDYSKRLFDAATPQIVMIKLADRLHNLRTILYMPDAAWIQKKVNQTYTDILAPIDRIKDRLGGKYESEIAELQEKVRIQLSVVQKELDGRIQKQPQ